MVFGKRFSIHIAPSKPTLPHCPVCRGSGTVRARGQTFACKACKGHGIAPTVVEVYRDVS